MLSGRQGHGSLSFRPSDEGMVARQQGASLDSVATKLCRRGVRIRAAQWLFTCNVSILARRLHARGWTARGYGQHLVDASVSATAGKSATVQEGCPKTPVYIKVVWGRFCFLFQPFAFDLPPFWHASIFGRDGPHCQRGGRQFISQISFCDQCFWSIARTQKLLRGKTTSDSEPNQASE